VKYKTIKDLLATKKYKRPDNYCGSEWHNHIAILGRSRDSQILEQSNFEVALAELGGESDCECDENDCHCPVIITRSSHWAVGWVEELRVAIHDTKKLKIALKLLNRLDEYPILDESDYSERELDEVNETWEYNSRYMIKDFLKDLGFKNPDYYRPNSPRYKRISDIVYRIFSYEIREDAWYRFSNAKDYFRGDAKWEFKGENDLFTRALVKEFKIQIKD